MIMMEQEHVLARVVLIAEFGMILELRHLAPHSLWSCNEDEA